MAGKDRDVRRGLDKYPPGGSIAAPARRRASGAMFSSRVKSQVSAGVLGFLLASCLANAALAQDAAPTGPAASVTPLDITPTPSPTPRGEIDDSPTGAVPTRSTADGVSRLDLSPPPGLALQPPPEAPVRIELAPGRDPTATAPTDDRADFSPPPNVSSGPAPIGTPSPQATTPALAARPDAGSPDATPSPVETPALVARPDPAASPTAPSATPDAGGVAGEIHAELDRLTAAPASTRPIGAGDWNAALKAIAAVYAERDYAPLWIDDNGFGDRAKTVLTRLARADEDGLDLRATPLPPDFTGGAAPQLADADIALSAAVVAYAMQASGARVRPRSLSQDVTADPEVADPGFALKRVAGADDPDAALVAFNPPQAGYAQLRAVLERLRGRSAEPVAHLPAGPELKLGMSDPRVPLIRARFGLGAASDPAAAEIYDVRVVSAVAAFQRIHGLKVNGALNVATSEALEKREVNTKREQLILANMEMWRWEPHDMGETHVEVNVPDFSLELKSGDRVVHRARVIVGKPDTPTPIFSNAIRYMLFNPVWRVPQSIIKKEMAPKLARDPDWLARHGYKVTYVGNQIEVQQPPGEANALGRMLFLFPNEHAVYLHDTPQRSLFSASFRALSHGCVRVEDPSRLAEILMGGAARGWTEAKVQSLVGDKERTLSLPTPVPIHLEYFTEFVDDSGRLQERDDLYGLTSRVAAALASFRRD
jgi:murein L,D-transpeptidase YcbB/YkuD